MRVGVIQSNYIPWMGYFDFIRSVDLFVFHDDIQYTKNDWRNRNKIKTRNGSKWLTVPVHYRKTDQLICETEIDYSTNWVKDHLNQFRENYSDAPNFEVAQYLLRTDCSYPTISELNIYLIKMICLYLDIKTPLMNSSVLDLKGSKTERLIDLLKKVDATEYLSGPLAANYLDVKQFEDNNIKLEYIKYDVKPYPQLWGEFNPNVSVLDYIANENSPTVCG